MLKSLEISGFKSFAKKSQLGFGAPITSIVGPNGSGKSNVAEAFRFVLGEQSMKSLRGKRGEDLIWSGSNETPRANRAAVKLIFDNRKNNGKKLFSLDFDEISIERSVGRDGENEYAINGSRVRLKDVIELLAEAHIGASGHQIISQGEADRVLRASTKERREMIEDALSLKIYLYKREESERKLVKTEENIKQAESLRREIAPHLRFLKAQVAKFEKAEELREKLIIFYKQYLKREKFYLENARKNLSEQKGPLQIKLEELENEMMKTKKVLENSDNKDKKSEEILDIERDLENTRKGKEILERELGKIEGEMSSNKRSIERTLELVRSEEGRVVKIREVEELAEQIFLLSDIDLIYQKIREFVSKFKEKIDMSLVEEMEKRNEELGAAKQKAEVELEEKERKLTEINASYNRVRESVEKEKESGREAEKAIFRISAEQSEIRGRLNMLLEHEHGLIKEEEDFMNQVKEGGVLLGQQIVGFENLEISNIDVNREIQEESRRELEKMKIRLEELGGAGGAEVMKEYQEVKERDEFLFRELEDLKNSAESLQILIRELEEKLDVEFKEGIKKINESFQKFFSIMFDGGEARLEIIKNIKRKIKIEEGEEEEPLEMLAGISSDEIPAEKDGLDIAVSLPRKRIKGLEMLSGGERALTSIALLFAISAVNPPPFIILDETDAALDEANSKKYGNMIESLSKYSQLILITHNRETMSRAGIIYGITMGKDGVSRLLSIAFDEAVAVAK